GSWTLGPAAELNSLRVTAVGARAPVTIQAAGCSASPGTPFGITLCVSSPLSPADRAAFERARSRWQDVITGDLPDVPVRWAAGQCDARSKSIDLVVDDLLIFAAVETIDGPGAVLGTAGPCMIRDAAAGRLPVVGVMRFD